MQLIEANVNAVDYKTAVLLFYTPVIDMKFSVFDNKLIDLSNIT